MPELAVLDHDAVLAAVSPAAAIDATRDAFLRHHSGEWVMPAKVYLAEPALRRLPRDAGARRRPRAAEVGHLVSRPTSAKGLPTVNGVVCLSDARTGVPLALLDAPRGHGAAHRRRRGRRVARAGARRMRARVGIVGCGLQRRRGRRAAWPPPATGRASASTRAPAAADGAGGGARLGGRRPRRGAGVRHRLLHHAGRRDRRRRATTCGPAST